MTGAIDNAAWAALVDDLEDVVSPEWMRHARDSGDTAWIRAILLVDVHDLLAGASTTERVAETLYHLAADREPEQAAGWEALHAQRREARRVMAVRIEETGASMLPAEQAALFSRSIDTLQVR